MLIILAYLRNVWFVPIFLFEKFVVLIIAVSTLEAVYMGGLFEI